MTVMSFLNEQQLNKEDNKNFQTKITKTHYLPDLGLIYFPSLLKPDAATKKHPAVGVPVKLIDRDHGDDRDDLLDERKTDEEGKFHVTGGTYERVTIEPALKIYHDCNDGEIKCQKRLFWDIPAKYVSTDFEQEQAYLASTTTTTAANVASLSQNTINSIRHSLGGFIRQEISETGQTICFYRYNTADTAIPYLCELGCCSHGCCTISDIAARSTSFGWAIALLVMVLITIVFAVLALLTVWLMNRHKDKIHKQQLAESTIESPSVSQISGPTSFYPDVQYNYHLGGTFKSY
ncbi:unnamed protein product [Caenorhabditis sp. 36 PRJEB53466]|nr:unnamed protein product [Caenorhabditis sp. 36 PRJEB53466]